MGSSFFLRLSHLSICLIFWGCLHFWGNFHFRSSLLKSPIFVIQKAAAPKNGVEFCQNPICAVRCSLAMSCDDWQRRATSMRLTGTGGRTDRTTYWVRLRLWLKICLKYYLVHKDFPPPQKNHWSKTILKKIGSKSNVYPKLFCLKTFFGPKWFWSKLFFST